MGLAAGQPLHVWVGLVSTAHLLMQASHRPRRYPRLTMDRPPVPIPWAVQRLLALAVCTGWLEAVCARWLLSLCMGYKACTWLGDGKQQHGLGTWQHSPDCCRGAQSGGGTLINWMWGGPVVAHTTCCCCCCELAGLECCLNGICGTQPFAQGLFTR